MPEPTTAAPMTPQEAFAILTLADSTHGFHSLTPGESRAVARVPVALDVLRGVVERLEAVERDRDEHAGMAAEWIDSANREAERRTAAEARVQELERALRIVRDWIREGIGTEAEAAEAMDAALEPPEPSDA